MHESPILSEEEVIYECSDKEGERERPSEFEYSDELFNDFGSDTEEDEAVS